MLYEFAKLTRSENFMLKGSITWKSKSTLFLQGEEDCMKTMTPRSGICYGTIFLGHTGDGDHYVAIAPTNKVNKEHSRAS